MVGTQPAIRPTVLPTVLLDPAHLLTPRLSGINPCVRPNIWQFFFVPISLFNVLASVSRIEDKIAILIYTASFSFSASRDELYMNGCWTVFGEPNLSLHFSTLPTWRSTSTFPESINVIMQILSSTKVQLLVIGSDRRLLRSILART